jgi:hypothetical protein
VRELTSIHRISTKWPRAIAVYMCNHIPACFVHVRAMALIGIALSAITASANYTFTKEADHLYICSFNVYMLGSIEQKYRELDGTDGDTEPAGAIPERIRSLARVIASADFDLVVLQEVTFGEKGNWALTDLVQELNHAHGRNYSFYLSGHIGQGMMPEAMAFIFNPDVVKPQVLLGTTSQVENIEIPGRDLVRTKWVAGNFDFTLISAHLAWGNESERREGDRMILQILTTPTPSRFSDDPDIVVVGDINRFGLNFSCFDGHAYDPARFLAPNIVTFDPALNTRKEVKASHLVGTPLAGMIPQFLSTTVAQNTSVYDVFMLTPDADEELPGTGNTITYGVDFGIVHFDEPGGFGFQPGADTMTHQKLKEEYSDHRPLWMRFRTDVAASDTQGAVPVETRYVATASGRRFHLPGCHTIANSTLAIAWTSREAAVATHGPCGICKP